MSETRDSAPAIEVHVEPVGLFQTNAWFLRGADRDEVVIVDPGSDHEPLIDMIDPLAWARIAPHQTWSPHGSSSDEASGSSVSGSIRCTQPNGGGPENAGIVPPTNHSPGLRRTIMTFQRPLWIVVTDA